MEITKQNARRYLLGRQGLWPGRRWLGKVGSETAVHELEAVQIDTITTVARNHDLVLWSRVVDYDTAYLDSLLYTERRFFDYGGILMIYPITELPYWRAVMRRRGEVQSRAEWAAQNGDLIEDVKRELRARGPLGNRDMAGQQRVESYRSGKDTGVALYYLWTIGELMTHSRRGFERLYGFREGIAPPPHDYEAGLDEAEHFFARKAVRATGLGTASEWRRWMSLLTYRSISAAEARHWLDELMSLGELASVTVHGRKEPCYFPSSDLLIMETLAAGGVPDAWQPIEASSQQEANLLAPLDNLIQDRKRTQSLFDFSYIWEVYKPVEQRLYGHYTMPILFGDALAGRLSPKLDRKSKVLRIEGLWLEDERTADDELFVSALSACLRRFASFHGAKQIDLSLLSPTPLRQNLARTV